MKSYQLRLRKQGDSSYPVDDRLKERMRNQDAKPATNPKHPILTRTSKPTIKTPLFEPEPSHVQAPPIPRSNPPLLTQHRTRQTKKMVAATLF